MTRPCSLPLMAMALLALAACAEIRQDPFYPYLEDGAIGAGAGLGGAALAGASGATLGIGAGIGAATMLGTKPYLEAHERRVRECRFFVNRC